MTIAGWTSFFVNILLLLFLSHQGVGAVRDNARLPLRHHEDNARESTTYTVREKGEKREMTDTQSKLSEFISQSHSRAGEKRTTPQIQESVATRTEVRNNDYSHVRNTPDYGIPADDRTERTHDRSGAGSKAERTHTGDHLPRTNGQPPSHTREHTQIHTTNGGRHNGGEEDTHSRTQSKHEAHSKNTDSRPLPKSLGTERTKATKEERQKSDAEERTSAGEEDAVAKTSEAHAIGLINGLDGRAHIQGRSIDVQARQLDTTTIILASSIGGFAALIFLFFCIAEVAKRRREKRADSTRLLRVFQYLHEFNVDDIDIQLSAAGGFHVGYINGLAKGVNTKKLKDQQTDSSSEGSGSLSKKV